MFQTNERINEGLIMRNTYYGDYNYMERVEAQRQQRIARTKQVRKQKILLSVGIFLTILIISLLSVRALVYANDNNTSANNTKLYKSVVIYCGDTVSSIAVNNFSNEYENTANLEKEILSINHLASDEKLIAGNSIIVPYYN